ncbi:MAG: hypothetical protein ABII22_06460 [Candidatus Micrarchaeota archaeon]
MAKNIEARIIIVLVIIIAVLIIFTTFFKHDLKESTAIEFVMKDLQAKYPNGEVEVLSVTTVENGATGKYYEIKAKATEDAQSKCPIRTHIYYNYPTQNFVQQAPEYLTKGCRVCTKGPCVIAFPEEAIIASHTLSGSEGMNKFLEFNPSAIPVAKENEDKWVVVWGSAYSNTQYVVEVSKNGKILAGQEIEKPAS